MGEERNTLAPISDQIRLVWENRDKLVGASAGSADFLQGKTASDLTAGETYALHQLYDSLFHGEVPPSPEPVTAAPAEPVVETQAEPAAETLTDPDELRFVEPPLSEL